ncbi:hypothetical protein BJX63DRAFT_391094 [Aspergillus granulosus]|uniref:Uncharacterized protein n=1 Tax=Aspergillus granulosus TaxID=176169 RepID=A0ABR4HHW3_9EURO
MENEHRHFWHGLELYLPPEKYGPDTSPPEGHELAVPFLYSPLPDELPTGVHKDLLLLYAAYVGNIDHYVRLRDPNHFIKYEFECVIRGIYHDTMFAKWWSLQPDHPDADGGMPAIRKAIHARYIMNNDLSHIDEEANESCLPYLVWHPNFAHWDTYIELARRRPAMKAQAARACIAADYEHAYKQINPTPDWFLVEQARRKADTNAYYQEDLLRRAEQMGIDVSTEPPIDERWKIIAERTMTYWRSPILPAHPAPEHTVDGSEYWENYNGFGVDLSSLEMFVSVSEEWKRRRNGGVLDLTAMYREASCQRDST